MFESLHVSWLPAHVGSQSPVISLELIGDLKGQGSAKSQISQGEVNHEDDGRSLGGGTKEEEPYWHAISYQVDDCDQHVDNRNGNTGGHVLKQQ